MSARAWLVAEGRRARRAALIATGLAAVGAGAGILAAGLLAERLGLLATYPEFALFPWLGAVLAGLAVIRWRLPAVRSASPSGVGAVVERIGGLRAGALAGLAGEAHGSPALAAFADRRMGGWIESHGAEAARRLGRDHRRALTLHGSAGLAGIVVLAAATLGHRPAVLWRPFMAIREARAPVTLSVDRTRVARGEAVNVRVEAPGRRTATLHQRRAGEAWTAVALPLPDGTGVAVVGPLEADLELVAESGRRRSDTVRVALHPSLFLAELAVTARYPAYLDRPDEPIAAQGDTVSLPVGTVVAVQARATLPLAAAAWSDGSSTVPLSVDGTRVRGTVTITRSGTWTLVPRAADTVPLEGMPPSFTAVAVPDVAPQVTLVVPSADTVMPTSLVQPLVIETSDDHRVMRLEVVSRRVSRLGTPGPPAQDPVPLPDEGIERGVVMAQLDLNQRGFLPGDTAYVRVRATDNAPRARVTETDEIRLRLPSLAELRESVRSEARALTAAADSLAEAQREVERAVQDLAQERMRDPADSRGLGRTGMDFQQAERAGTLGAEQREVLQQADELRERLAALDRTAWEAGLTDPELHARIAELRQLLDRALTPELEAALQDLEAALERLDADAMRSALERMAQAQEELRRELERSRSLFERAALEGDLTALADDAADLAAEQRAWNAAASERVDSASAAEERRLAAAADSLAARLGAAEQEMAEAGTTSEESAAEQAARAAREMQQASAAAAENRQAAAVQAGQRASEQLDPLSSQLTDQRDAMREAWRQEVAAQLDAALVETARLARSQEDVVRRLERGESGAEVRAEQGATREGLERVMARVQDAAGKNALVAPTMGMALGYTRNRMGTALEQLQQGVPNTRSAAEAAGEALDGLNLLATQLLRSRGDVAGAESGSGLAEAVERMAELADQQGQMAGQSGGLLPMMQ